MEGFFERIPVAVVKKMMELPSCQDTANSISDGPAQDGWRDLAEQVQRETDPQKMLDLVEQLITKYDEEKVRKPLGIQVRATTKS